MREQLKRDDNCKNYQVGDKHWEEDNLRRETTLTCVSHYVGVVTQGAGCHACVGVLEIVKSAGETAVRSALAGRALGTATVAGLVE